MPAALGNKPSSSFLVPSNLTLDGRTPTDAERAFIKKRAGDKGIFGFPVTGLTRLGKAREAGLIDAFGSLIEQPQPTQTVPAPIPQPEPQPTAVNKTGSSDSKRGGTTPKKKKEERGRGSARSALLLSGGGGKLG
jgi:hypothetical protein